MLGLMTGHRGGKGFTTFLISLLLRYSLKEAPGVKILAAWQGKGRRKVRFEGWDALDCGKTLVSEEGKCAYWWWWSVKYHVFSLC